jgi:uncharacterized protein YjeT (DUF2065 family)
MRLLVRSIWLILICLVIVQGVLQCFYPEALQRVRDRLGRLLELTSPGERVRPGRAGKASFMQRAFGFMLILIGLLFLMTTLGVIR